MKRNKRKVSTNNNAPCRVGGRIRRVRTMPPVVVVADELRSKHVRCCDNCRRRGVRIHPINARDIPSRRLKFSLYEKKTPDRMGRCHYLLCDKCVSYLVDRSTMDSDIWPSFVWHSLSSYDIGTTKMVLRMLPVEWQEWWEASVYDIHPLLESQKVGACTMDISEMRNRCESNLVLKGTPVDNMKNCSWREFVLLMESCLTIPTVRCPWGCSEFIGCSSLNLLPFDVVVQNFVNRSLLLYSGTHDCFKAKLYGFRRDLFEGEGFAIMGNPNWRCRPSIIMRDGVPFFMACRFHRTTDLGSYIHLPRNPTGSISFNADDSKAQVVAVPRTLAKFKRHNCSNAYSIRKVCGNYSGIDSLNLCICGPEHGWNFVSQRRHFLSLACRSEVADPRRSDIGLKAFDQEDVYTAQQMFDECNKKSLADDFGKGATYVSLEDVFRTQRRLKEDDVRQIRVQITSPSGLVNDESVSFRPVWANHQLPVKLMNDPLGSTFPCFKAGSKELKRDVDLCVAVFFAWNLMHVVPEVWNCLDHATINNRVWYGWVLQYLSTDLLHYKSGKKKSASHPFALRQKHPSPVEKAIQAFRSQCSVNPNQQQLGDIEGILWNAFNNIPDLCLIRSVQRPSQVIINREKVVVIVAQIDDTSNHFPLESIPGYELRFLGCKNIASTQRDSQCSFYGKHKGLTGVWRYDRNNQAHIEFAGLDGGFHLENHLRDWRIMVFVKICDPDYDKIKYDLLCLQGGQSIVHCEEHKDLPFVALPVLGRCIDHPVACTVSCCHRKQHYGCPMKGCDRGICCFHLKQYTTEGDCVYVGGVSLNTFAEQLVNTPDEDSTDVSYSDDEEDISQSRDSFAESDEETNGSDNENTYSDDDYVSVESYVTDWSVSETDSDTDSDDRSLSGIIDIVNELDYGSCEEDSQSDCDKSDGFMEVADSEEDDAPIIPVTSCVKQPIYFEVSKLLENGDAMPNHVLLNTHGNCLIRKNKKLSATKRARYFLERLACVSKGKNIPLLYPEAMMFPSVFWMQEEEGAFVGAIPCCGLMDKTTLDSLGLASLYDHSRTRLLDPTVLSSTNVRYLSFLWDMAANLGLRGASATLVLSRGFSDMMKQEGLKVGTEDPRLFDYHQIDSRATVNQLAAASARIPNDFFFTWTMNGLKTPGVRVIFDWCRTGGALEQFTEDMFNGYFAALPDVNTLGGGFDLMEQRFLSNSLEEAFGVFVIRAWMEFIPQFLYYLQYGRDSPFRDVAGGVRHIWNHSEIQSDSDANAPHNHSLIYMRNPPQTEEGILELCGKIRASMETFCGHKEFIGLGKAGLLDSYRMGGIGHESYDEVSFLNDAKIVLSHHCTKRCNMVTRKVFDGGEEEILRMRRCKFPQYRLMSPQYCHDHFIPVPVNHRQEAIQVMSDVGMIEKIKKDGVAVSIIPTAEFKKKLTAERHCPPCYPADYSLSSSNPVLFAMLLSAMNLQYVTTYLLMRYLVKYCASVDKGNHLRFKSSKRSPGNLEVEAREGLNTKITRNAIHEQKVEDKQTKRGIIDGRSLSLAEMVMQFLQYPRITTTFRFEAIPTGPMGMRTTVKTNKSGVDRLKGRNGVGENPRVVHDVNVQQNFAGYAARKRMGLCQCRQFDNYQVVTFADTLFQTSSVDKVTQFSLRPPELSFVMSYPKYHIWFKRSDVKLEEFRTGTVVEQQTFLVECLNAKYDQCPWIDALGFEIRVRRAAISKIIKLLHEIFHGCLAGDRNAVSIMGRCFGYDVCLFQEVVAMFCTLATPEDSHHEASSGYRQQLISRFVCETEDCYTDCPVYWFRTVRASRGEEFLYHLLLSMGQFKSEYEIYSQGSLQHAFQYCGMIPTLPCPREELENAVKSLVKEYAKHQLCSYPLGTKSFDRELVTAYELLMSYLVEGTLFSNELPPALYTNLRDVSEADTVAYLDSCRKKLVTSYCSYLRPLFGNRLPTADEIVDALWSKCVEFDLTAFGVGEEGTAEAAEEHLIGRRAIVDAVAHYKAASQFRTKSIGLVGAGGVGKTVDLRLAGLYCCCQGLYVLSTSYTGKRSAEVAGEHIHVRFQVPVNDSLNVAQMADRCYTSLLKDGKRMMALQRVDVLLLDELGQCSVKLISCLDVVMRRIRHSSHWMGGVLLITTMDVKQLKPIRGLPPIFSPAMLTSFDYVEYTVPLRTHDPVLMKIQEITRMTANQLGQDGVKEMFMDLAGGEDGFQFVQEGDLASLPSGPDVTYCYPKHEDCGGTESRILREMKNRYQPRGQTRSAKAKDSERTATQQHDGRASSSTSKVLDKKVGPSRNLLFYPYATFTITYNYNEARDLGEFFHGQLCIILELPKQDDLDKGKPICVYRAPPGVDDVPPYEGDEPNYTAQQLESLGWEKVWIGKDPHAMERSIVTGKGSTARREQYGLRHRITVTIHAVMGSTLGKLICRMDGQGGGMWDSSMAVVLLSRTRRAKDIYFIGDKQRTLDNLWATLIRGGQYNEACEHLMECLIKKRASPPMPGFVVPPPKNCRFIPLEAMLPLDGEYAVYMIVSLKDVTVTYIGHSKRLRRRLNSHNSSAGGSSGTGGAHRSLAPWGLFCYIKGFQNKTEAMEFEGRWQAVVHNAQNQSGGRLSCEDRCQCAQQCMRGGAYTTVCCGWIDSG